MPLLPKSVYCAIKSVNLKDERGLGTIEMVVLMAVLIGAAFLFKDLIKSVFDRLKAVIDGKGLENL
ncbi:hypothetical protein ISU02_01915 [Fusibacter sp. Q10-2]|uniref:Putative Flagellin Flp1-like domain-containing protein n=2 Tax=Fusibacter ferrireducens TaxID=2785058 RepID=A0ABR9ZN03_9FIRM|nr:hypothetical protein [Fusibacter ferrireducens]